MADWLWAPDGPRLVSGCPAPARLHLAPKQVRARSLQGYLLYWFVERLIAMPAPFAKSEVEDIVKEYISNNDTSDINSLIQYVLGELKAKSTDYKVIVSATVMSQEAAHVNAKHSVGFLWNDDTDGHYALKFQTEGSWLLVSVSYIKL